jgi:hypothetical protein
MQERLKQKQLEEKRMKQQSEEKNQLAKLAIKQTV